MWTVLISRKLFAFVFAGLLLAIMAICHAPDTVLSLLAGGLSTALPVLIGSQALVDHQEMKNKATPATETPAPETP